MFFSIFKIDFFPENWKKFLGLFWFWNYSWWSILWPEKILMAIVHIGFKNRQKVVFVSLKKHQKVDYLHRYWLFSNFLFWFEFLSWRYIFPENLACTRLFFTNLVFFSMVFIYRLKRPLYMDWVVQKNSGFLFLS